MSPGNRYCWLDFWTSRWPDIWKTSSFSARLSSLCPTSVGKAAVMPRHSQKGNLQTRLCLYHLYNEVRAWHLDIGQLSCPMSRWPLDVSIGDVRLRVKNMMVLAPGQRGGQGLPVSFQCICWPWRRRPLSSLDTWLVCVSVFCLQVLFNKCVMISHRCWVQYAPSYSNAHILYGNSALDLRLSVSI